jgi:type II secretory pathway pseudopilin PulG
MPEVFLMKNLLKKNKKGFSLAEILIVLCVITIIGGAGGLALSNHAEKARFIRAHRELDVTKNAFDFYRCAAGNFNGIAPSATLADCFGGGDVAAVRDAWTVEDLWASVAHAAQNFCASKAWAADDNIPIYAHGNGQDNGNGNGNNGSPPGSHGNGNPPAPGYWENGPGSENGPGNSQNGSDENNSSDGNLTRKKNILQSYFSKLLEEFTDPWDRQYMIKSSYNSNTDTGVIVVLCPPREGYESFTPESLGGLEIGEVLSDTKTNNGNQTPLYRIIYNTTD